MRLILSNRVKRGFTAAWLHVLCCYCPSILLRDVVCGICSSSQARQRQIWCSTSSSSAYGRKWWIDDSMTKQIQVWNTKHQVMVCVNGCMTACEYSSCLKLRPWIYIMQPSPLLNKMLSWGKRCFPDHLFQPNQRCYFMLCHSGWESTV